MKLALTRRQKNEILKAQLDQERSSFIPHWRDLGDYILSRRPRFTVSEANKGDRRNQKIIDSTASLAARTLRSGMMSGITSPARPWFRLTTPDPRLAENEAVKAWLHQTTQDMATVFQKSNLYNVLPIIYGDIGTFATAAMSVEEDFEDVVRFYAFPIGSYRIANNDRLKVDVFMRDFRMTVRQVIHRFGRKTPDGSRLDMDHPAFWMNFSDHVRSCYDQKQLETWIDVVHLIEPNDQYDPKRVESKYKRYLSCYYEQGDSSKVTSSDDDRYLSEKGYDHFPILCPRWEVTGEDVYGTSCPGMEALGDIKQLQLGEKRGAQAIEKKVNPPMVGPSSMRNFKSSTLPGDITYVDTHAGGQSFQPAHDVNLSITELEEKQEQIRMRIKRAYFEDIILMFQNDLRNERATAAEVNVKDQERLMAFGPVLEQFDQDVLSPLIDITFNFMEKQGRIAPPPKELEGVALKVEYTSVMAQAQKLIGLGGMERFMGMAQSLAATDPRAMRKVNTDQYLDLYGDMTSLPPGILRSDEEIAEMDAADAAAVKAQNAAAVAQQGASAARELSQTDLESDNALTRLMGGGGEMTGT